MNTSMRYFADIAQGDVALNLFRFQITDTSIVEDEWVNGQWKDVSNDGIVSRFIATGESPIGNINEISLAAAKARWPEAFRNE